MTPESNITLRAPVPIAPLPAENQVDAIGQRSRREIASTILEDHRYGLQSRHQNLLIAEKLLLHIDGSGGFPWADILDGTRVEIPHDITEYHKSENLLLPIVENAVSHHTSSLRYYVKSPADARSRERALMDMIFANHLAEHQDLSMLFAEAMYMAMAAAFCLVHGYWRDDAVHDWFEPVSYDIPNVSGPAPGMIDCFVGNPFDTVFDRAARPGSVRWCSYGRVLPADDVRKWFANVPEAQALEGSARRPTASVYQEIVKNWNMAGLGRHGTPYIHDRRGEDGELLAVICRETAPGYLAEYPKGRLQIIAVPGHVDLRHGRGGNPVLLADQSLPGAGFSWAPFYSYHRSDDIYGKPWVENLDDMQVDLNIALSEEWDLIRRQAKAPIITPGGAIGEDMVEIDGYNIVELEPSLAGWRPRVMEWPQGTLVAIRQKIEDLRSQMYTLGGYQAVSRGESPGSRTPASAIQLLQAADSRVHGPTNRRFARSACEFMANMHRQFRTYADVAWLATITGDEFAYLAETYIDRTTVSDSTPRYRLVNTFGATPEQQAQEILSLVTLRGSDGQPFLRTDEARRAYPNVSIFDDAGNPATVARRRAKTVAHKALALARQLRMELGVQAYSMPDPAVQQASEQLFRTLEEQYPRLRDDDLQAHISAYGEVTQDETADPIARLALIARQENYYAWQYEMATQGQPQAPAPQGAPTEPQLVAA